MKLDMKYIYWTEIGVTIFFVQLGKETQDYCIYYVLFLYLVRKTSFPYSDGW